MYNHQKEWAITHMARLQQLHQDFQAKYDAVQYLQVEGMTECTLRSQSAEVSLGLNSGEIVQEIVEAISSKLDSIEDQMAHHKLHFAADLSEAPILAQQAAAPTPKKRGRPRAADVIPLPAVVQQVGQQAALVPMNSGTALAAGRATQPTPQG